MSHSAIIQDMIDAVRTAGDMAMHARRTGLAMEDKQDGTVVTGADKASENILKALAVKHGFSFLGEESGNSLSGNQKRLVADPIDGTTNFAAGAGTSLSRTTYPSDPNWAVSLALKDGDETVAGVVYAPATGDLFWAEKGRGAWVLNAEGTEAPLHHGAPLDQKITMGTGYFPGKHPDKIKKKLTKAFSKAAEKQKVLHTTRDIGSIAMGLIHVATSASAAYACVAHEWDYAAATLIIAEAGGKVAVTPAEKGKDFVIAGQASLQPALVEAYKPYAKKFRKLARNGVTG